jgi:gas vesicle protein
MGRFFRGLLIGAGIGLLVAPMRGEDLRRLLSERYAELRDALPENEQLKQAGQQFTAGVSQTANQLRDYTQQAASKVKETGSSLSDLTQQTASQIKQTGQQTTQQVKQTAQNPTNSVG